MDKTITDKLVELLKAGDNVSNEVDYYPWKSRVAAFISASLGAKEGTSFDALEHGYWRNELAMKLGYLEGLLTKANSDTAQAAVAVVVPQTTSPALDARKVFLVHGHDDQAKESVARFLEKLGLEIIILHEQPSEGRTIIEKFENYSSDVAYAIVLLTPDDVGNAAAAAATLNKRARQNVIMELGYFMGKLGRNRVCALYKGGVELPSDYQGVLYIDMEDNGWKAKVAQELVQSKLPIDVQALLAVLGS